MPHKPEMNKNTHRALIEEALASEERCRKRLVRLLTHLERRPDEPLTRKDMILLSSLASDLVDIRAGLEAMKVLVIEAKAEKKILEYRRKASND